MEGPDLTFSLSVLVVALVLGGTANWQLRKPAHQRLWPAVPWLAVQFVAAAAVLVFAAHVVTLLSGHHFASRNGY
jgi:predicted membrane metal-binding protein